ncbi:MULTISPECIES: hypothetical protein [unclassified Duganella]|uniref:hypothetical protein n=1 Tax=unclassified Duganella TaxID=2636909 RepID=UPI0006F4365D|nr:MULTISPECIES: hypothetical protein [unclassified Duganella]KQV61682.1 hypothetical protein ASD07_02240 [Duganella sp. Root336D2]KRB84190.1 hypothetical protein ASE26_08905 [Duganella sp. Root198D2]
MTKLKLLLKMVASFLALLLLLIAFVFFINREDKPPSESVIKLQGIETATTPVGDRDNAYVYVMGFSAPDNSDVMSEGVDRVEQMRKSMGTSVATGFREMPGEKQGRREPAQLIERYEHLLEFKQWREVLPGDARLQGAAFNQVLEAQRLMYLRALSQEVKADAGDCKRMLEEDYRFWRMVLAESISANVKMLAARSIELHFEMGNLVVRRFPATLTMTAIPEGWREPFSNRERSLAKIMAHEWTSSDLRPDDERSGNVLAMLFGSFLYQPQATSNANADRMLRVVELYDRDYAAIPQAAATFLASYGNEKKAAADIGVYNPVGRILLNMQGMDAYTTYGFRVVNLEGMRRVALLAAQLRSSGANGNKVAEGVRTSELRDPYDGEEFAWDPEHSSLLFSRTLEGKPDFKILY